MWVFLVPLLLYRDGSCFNFCALNFVLDDGNAEGRVGFKNCRDHLVRKRE